MISAAVLLGTFKCNHIANIFYHTNHFLLPHAVGADGTDVGIGHIRTRTHDYIRHGTVTLFAALSYLSGKVFGLTAPRHTHKEWLAFLQLVEAA